MVDYKLEESELKKLKEYHKICKAKSKAVRMASILWMQHIQSIDLFRRIRQKKSPLALLPVGRHCEMHSIQTMTASHRWGLFNEINCSLF